jgi:two-component system, cell cycle sensor histidine kinase and response regulator CckA
VSAEIVFGLEAAAWPALLVDPRGKLVRANTSASGAFGAALDGNAANLSSVWPSENGETVEQFFARWEQAPSTTVPLKFRMPDGRLADFSASICAFNKEGRKWYVLQLFPASLPQAASVAVPPSNAVEKNSVAESASIHKQKLDCALQLARTVSLDFNNALTSVLGHTSLLLSKAEPGHPWRHSLIEVEKSAVHAAEISNELGVFSQQEKQTRRIPPGNLNVVASRCLDFFKNTHGDKISWNVTLEKDLFASRFDEAKLQQAVTKVLENAVEAVNGKGQIRVQTRNIELTTPTQDRNVKLTVGAYVCVEISDNGSGIDPANLQRIFEPFFTTKQPPHRGLGLALVYGIVSNHGGGVAISSEPGAGAAARIYLPAEKQLISQTIAPDKDLHGSESILVVDDESMLLTMAETIFGEYGYKVVTANNGQKALAMLSRDDIKVDLLVTDLVMPAMGGRELIERARQLHPRIKILCMSGCVLPPEQQVGLAYLQKPFTSRDLLAKARHVLSKN